MRFKPLHLALLVFQMLWLNVVLPGHTRGLITLGGSGGSSCHPSTTAPTCCETKQHPGKGTPTQEDRERCAVCHYAMRVTPPPVYDYRLTELGLRELLPVPPPVVADSAPLPPTYYGRGPPAA